jgi:hypothetical protein
MHFSGTVPSGAGSGRGEPTPSDRIRTRSASLELSGTAILLAEGTALGVVRYEMTSRASHTGEWASAGVLHAPAGLIDGALRGAMITLRDEANAVELDIIVVRHEIGACEADIMLDEEACLSLAETDARLQLYG